MEKKKTIARWMFLLALFLCGTGLQAQNDDLPQVFSPNAAELGKYGKIPVSYFNGLPNISIPLTELRAKGYTLPVYLTYHARGNKPDQHPGWVGLGWTLHAGGCINRIVNGKKDELDRDEIISINGGSGPGFNPGYYWHRAITQNTDWTNPVEFATADHAVGNKDHAPDEFQINVDGIQASFYLMPGDSISIVSKSPGSIKVEIGPLRSGDYVNLLSVPSGAQLRARRYYYFESFFVTTDTGTKYTFGGTDDAIDYSVLCHPTSPGVEITEDDDRFIGGVTANTWYLTEIDYPNGETIHFRYVKDKMQLIRSAVHRSEYYTPIPAAFPPYAFDTKTFAPTEYYASYQLIRPSYLDGISCDISRDSLVFRRLETQELRQVYKLEEMLARTSFTNDSPSLPYSCQRVLSEDCYYQLTSIYGPRDSISLTYTHSDSTRLKLQEIALHDRNTRGVIAKYGLHYNETPLPPYGSKKTDLWGFYNGKDHSSVSWANMESFRTVNDSLMQAEILTQIDYPTGGHTTFEYETNTYRRIAHQYPFCLITESEDANAGGLRIKRICDVSADGLYEPRVFEYLMNGQSSGILSGLVSNHETGEQIVIRSAENQSTWHFMPAFNLDSATLHTGLFSLGSEEPIRPLSTTDGNHVTYSTVTEKFADGSYRVHHFSNHDSPFGLDHGVFQPLDNIDEIDGKIINQPISSMALFRGLEIEVDDYRSDNSPIRLETRTFRRDTTHYVKSFEINSFCNNRLLFAGYKKIFTDWPYLQSRTVATFPEDGGTPHIEATEYAYDDCRRLIEKKQTVHGVTDRETFTYTGNYPNGIYAAMASKNMIALLVEHLQLRKNTPQSSERVISAELTTWREGTGGRHVPSAQYTADLGAGLLPANFTPYSTGNDSLASYPNPMVTYTRTDSLGNILESVSRDSLYSSYLWDKAGVHPEMIAKNARNSFRKHTVTINHSTDGLIDYDQVPDPTVPVATLVTSYPGTLTLDIGSVDGQDWGVTLSITGAGTIMLGSHGISGNAFNALTDYRNTPSRAVIPLPVGSYPVYLIDVQHFFEGGDVQDEAPELTYEIVWTTDSSYSTGYDDVFHEDFEPETVPPGASQAGFHSYGYHTGGNYTFDLFTDPDRRYILDYRIRQNNGAWQYVRSVLNYSANGSYTIPVGSAKLDEVRVYPADSEVESYTWDNAGNLLSRTDSRGVTESYRYDGLGRLVGIYDNEGKKVEGYQYNYQNR